MTKKDKELLIKDLCSRIPYGIIVRGWYDKSINAKCIAIDVFTNTVGLDVSSTVTAEVYVDNVKPYLFPLSSMTVEQKAELEQIKNNEDAPYYHDINDFFLKYHLDNRHLIEKGLAIDATGLNIY